MGCNVSIFSVVMGKSARLIIDTVNFGYWIKYECIFTFYYEEKNSTAESHLRRVHSEVFLPKEGDLESCFANYELEMESYILNDFGHWLLVCL